MKIILNLVTISLYFILLPTLTAQERSISGVVIDKNDIPISNVSVTIKNNSSKGTTTNFDGEFSIKAFENSVLVFKHLEMEDKEVKLGSEDTLRVKMDQEITTLDEVITIGYGREKKKDLTGSVSSVQGEQINKRHKTNLSQALQGTMAGVTVTRNSSEPDATGDILIRGQTTIGNSDPLIIIDGVPASSIDDVNPNDVEDISVLKDAASASIYGSRAAAGVVLITTKSGKEGKTEIGYNVNYTISRPTSLPKRVEVGS